MTGEQVLAVHVGDEVPPVLAAFLSAATVRWTPVAADPTLASSTRSGHLYGADVVPRRPVGPTAVWVAPGQTWEQDSYHASTVRVLALPTLCDAREDDVVVSPRPAPAAAKPVLPFTRELYRRLRGLPDDTVLDTAEPTLTWGAGAAGRGARALTEAHLPTLFALAACGVVTGPRLPDALWWGCPVVTDPASAAQWQVQNDRHVVVADGQPDVTAAVDALMSDPVRAAKLARRAHVTMTARTPAGAAAALAARLGYPVTTRSGRANGLLDAMDSLRTPADAGVRARVRERTASLPGATTGNWLSPRKGDIS